jgi:hypothetical protein
VILVTVPIIAPGVDNLMAHRHLNSHTGTAAMIGMLDIVVSFVVPGSHAKLHLGTGNGGG